MKAAEQIKEGSMRDAFWDRIFKIAEKDRDVVIVSADQNSPSLDRDFRVKLPERFINVGIAEANAILVAAGLAKEGKKAFAYAIAPFITLRCFEQIKIELAAMKIPVTIVGVGAGFSYADSGPTHHTLEDISIMRALPHITIHSISDGVMAAAFADIACAAPAPRYIRLDRQSFPDLYVPESDFSDGCAVVRRGKGTVAIIATGSMVHQALRVAEQLEKNGIDPSVIDLYTLPVKTHALMGALGGVTQLFTLEEHFLPGGMGSAVIEVLSDVRKFLPVTRIGAATEKGYCYRYGGRECVRSFYGLDVPGIVSTILEKM